MYRGKSCVLRWLVKKNWEENPPEKKMSKKRVEITLEFSSIVLMTRNSMILIIKLHRTRDNFK